MLNEILIKRDAKIAELKNMIAGEMTAEKRASVEAMKSEIEGINKDIESMRFLEAQEKTEARKEFGKEEKKANARYDLFKALREGVNGLTGLEKEMHDYGVSEYSRNGAGYTEGLVIPQMILSQRADVLSSNTDKFIKTSQDSQLHVANTELILGKLGVQVYNDLVGNFDIPSMAELTAAFVAEDATSTVVTVTDAKATLTPRFIAANQIFSRQLLNQTSVELQNQILNQFLFAVEKGIEQEAFNQMSGLTTSNAAYTGATWANLLALQSYVPYSNAIVTSRTAMATLKAAQKATGSGNGFIWSDGTIDGIPTYSSSLVSAKHIYTGNFKEVVVGNWGGLIVLQDAITSKSKGKIEYQVAKMADVKIANTASFAKMVLA